MFLGATFYTVRNMLFGATLGIGAGVVSGLVIGYSRPLRWLVEPYLLIFQSFPRESLAPLFIVWLGFGAAPKVVNAALLSYFPTAVITLHGLLDTRKDYIELMRSWGASRFQEFLYCRLPALVPVLASATKLAAAMALIGAVLGEFMGGHGGLGYVIMTSGSAFRVDRIFGAVVCLAAVGVSIMAVVSGIQILALRRFNQE
jgi:NitT/TauT family transport system permease protein